FQVGEFWEAAPGGVGEFYEQLRSTLTGKGLPLRRLSAGDTLQLADNVTLEVLSPPPSAKMSNLSVNDPGLNEVSLVFRLRYGSFSILFTGDAGFPAEERIMADREDITATVLKVGHHGSRFASSDDFLSRVAPKAALISAGNGNRFGL